jgi:hypothetical protein
VQNSETSRSNSITPSDSASRGGSNSDGRSTSQRGRSTSQRSRPVSLLRQSTSHHRQLGHQPATRPSEYPLEVLWSLEDCKNDPDVRITPTNASRPPMEHAIRHPDGTMISSSEWSAIKATARMVKSDLLSLPPSRDRRAKDRQKTKTYFRTYHPREWESALDKMETQQPLLALCSAHWKADHVLGNTLLVKLTPDSDDSDKPDSRSDIVKNTRKPSESRKRTVNQHIPDPKRQKRSKERADEEMDIAASDQDSGTSFPRLNSFCIDILVYYLSVGCRSLKAI